MVVVTLKTNSDKMKEALTWLLENSGDDWCTLPVPDQILDQHIINEYSNQQWKDFVEKYPDWIIDESPKVVAIFAFQNKEDALKFKLMWC